MVNRFMCRVAVFLVLTLVCGAIDSAAQQLSIAGTVDDTYGIVQAVTVIVRAQDGMTRDATTDADGRYRFGDLKPGAYEVTVSKEGFTTATQAVVLSTQSQTVNLTLTIAGFVASAEVFDVAGKGTSTGSTRPFSTSTAGGRRARTGSTPHRP